MVLENHCILDYCIFYSTLADIGLVGGGARNRPIGVEDLGQ